MQSAKTGRPTVVSILPPIAPHLRESAVLRMLQEEEPESIRVAPQWPPPGHTISRPQGFMGKICTGKGPGGRPVEWPPRPEHGESQDQPDQVASSTNIDQVPPPVPPRPANYPQANSMEQVQQQQQQMMSQQHHQQQHQQQQQQQVTSSSSQVRTVKQTYQVKQHYEQRSSGLQQQTGAVRYQQPQQQSMQFQQSQQTSSTYSSQHPPVFGKQMAASPGKAVPPFTPRGPAPPQHNFPQHNDIQNAVPPQYASQPQYAPQNIAQPQYAPQNVPQPQYAPQNVPQPQYAPQNVPQPQYAPQNVPQPQYAPQNVPQPQYSQQNFPQPQYSPQNDAKPQQTNVQTQPQQSLQNAAQPQRGPQAQPQKAPKSQPQKAPQSLLQPVPVAVILGETNAPPPKLDAELPPGYSTAYSAVVGEWPPKINNAPNLTTTYPSGFKYREKAPLDNVPAKVVMSQPAFKISQPIRRRGDDKWPPKTGIEPVQNEVREFIKPKKMAKNYGEFFAQNALPHNYAAYRPPPGTQHRAVEDNEEDEEVEEEEEEETAGGVSNM
nr:adhesive plaque matrix protein-like [Procambarus clarkii]